MGEFDRVDEAMVRSLSGDISRRDLLKRVAAVGLASPVLGTLLAACGGDDAESDAEPDAGDATEETGDTDDASGEEDPDATESEDGEETEEEAAGGTRGGQVRVGIPGSADDFNPHTNTIFEAIWVNEMMYAGLTRVNPDLEPEPDLATEWESNETGDEWTFTIRDGVMFHNGRAMELDDIVQNFERILDPDQGSPHQSQISMVDAVEASGDNQVVFTLANPQPDLPALLGNYFARIIALEAIDEIQSAPVGCGPYQMSEHSPGERTVLTRFEDYYDTEDQAFLDEIHFVAMAEETTRLTALTGGSIEMVHEVSPSALPLVQDAPNVVVEEVVTGGHQPIVMDVRESPFDDVRIRQALKLCIDREQFLQAATQGHGELAADQPVPPNDPAYGNVPIPEQDFERAQQLLSEAGYSDGLQLTLHTSTARAGMQESALALQEMAQEIGIEIEVVNHPPDGYWADIWKQVPFFATNWSGRPSADNILTLLYVCDTDSTEAHWCNEEFDTTIDEARAAPDDQQRYELYGEAQRILSEEGPVLIPYVRSYINAYTNQLQGYEIHPLRFLDLRRAYLEE